VAPYQNLVVPHDFSDDAEAALDAAIALARQLGSELHLVHAYQQPADVLSPYGVAIPASVAPEIRESAERRLREVAARHEGAAVKIHLHVAEGVPWVVIDEAAREVGADLIVMGTRGLTGLRHLLLGSVAERTLRSASCPVLTVKARSASG
jgi:nucleotide-binding universal stress UspA family protein